MNKRLEELDLLRGLAALSVLFGHFVATLPALAWWFLPFQYGPLRLFTAGHQAVVFFFVLSGFVLSLPFLEGKTPVPYGAYVIKRILRIYPPYFCAAGAALFFRQWLYAGPVPGVGAWFNSTGSPPVTWSVIQNYLIMIGPFRGNDFIPVLWSLIHEMRISLIFPALVYLVRRRQNAAIALALFSTLSCLVLFWLRDRNVIREPFGLQTVEYIGTFIVGALLAKHRVVLTQRFAGFSRGKKRLLFGAAALLYTYAYWVPPLVGLVNPSAADLLSQQVLDETVTTAGVCLFILAALSASKLLYPLGTKPFKFLGAISYSLYLYHVVCLKVAVTALHARMPLGWVLVIAFVASFVVSGLSYYLVEIPSIHLGRWIAKRCFAARPVPAAEAVAPGA